MSFVNRKVSIVGLLVLSTLFIATRTAKYVETVGIRIVIFINWTHLDREWKLTRDSSMCNNVKNISVVSVLFLLALMGLCSSLNVMMNLCGFHLK